MNHAGQKESVDRFGFLPYQDAIVFDGGRVSPVAEYDKVLACVDEHTHEDGFLCPPLERRINESGEQVPRTERPAHLHHVPASHELLLYANGTKEDLWKGPGAFVIHLLAYRFGLRLQFHDWWFDGRIPIRLTHNIITTHATMEHFVSHCYWTWKGWPKERQKKFTNVLIMHSRVPSYEWDWERFMIEYIVFDGCYKLAEGPQRAGGAQRFDFLCNQFGIPSDSDVVQKIVGLRNDLFHETLWDNSQPCTGVSESAFMQSYYIRRLNQRLIPALLGYMNSYVQTSWWFHGSFSFTQP